MRASPLTSDTRAMSGKWQAFLLVIGFAFGFPLVGAIWPVATRRTVGDIVGGALWVVDSVGGGVSGQIVAGIVVLGILFTMLGGVFLAAEQVYGWIKKRRDGTVNEYQIK